MKDVLAFILFLLLALPAQARVFDFGKESFGTYLRGTYSNTAVEKAPFEKSSGAGMSFDNEFKYLPSYEFGFLWATKFFSLRMGFELVSPSKLKDVEATDASGNLIYKMSSEYSAAIPKIGVEINLDRKPKSRFFAHADWGVANLTIQNSYTFEAGQTTFPSLTDFRDETKSAVSTYSYSIGYEMLFFDTTTICFDAGYRQLNVGSMKHNVDVTNFQGSVVKGDNAVDDDGNNRSLDLSGPFVGVQLRFWIY